MRLTRLRAITSSIVVLVLSLVLSGCSSQADTGTPQVLPKRSTSPPSRTLKSSKLPSPPVSVVVKDAVARYYMTVGAAAQSGDVTTLRSLVATECPCTEVIDWIVANSREGRISGFNYSIENLRYLAREGRYAKVEAKYSVATIRVTNGAGKDIKSVPAVRHRRALLLLKQNGPLWLVDYIQFKK